MKPRKSPVEDKQMDLFRVELAKIIDPRHPLEAHYESVVGEHDRIIDGLTRRNAVQVKQLICDHIQTFRDRIIVFMTS